MALTLYMLGHVRWIMNMAFVVTLVLGFFTLRVFAGVPADSSYELTCRAKAKEIAAETYRSCVTEYKSSEIEHLRKNYQNKLKAMKNEYEQEIEKLGGKTKSAKRANTAIVKKSAKMAPGEDSPEIEIKRACLLYTSPSPRD